MKIRRTIKSLLVEHAVSRRILAATRPQRPRIFVYHRFSPPGQIVPHRVSQDLFGWQLDQMMNTGSVMCLADCIAYFRDQGKWPQDAIVVTVDDGYRDFYDHAYPELRARSLPATLFPVLDFVDRRSWLWPDRLEFALLQHPAAEFEVNVSGRVMRFGYRSEEQRAAVWRQLSDLCISLPDRMRRIVVEDVANRLSVTIPLETVPEYEACSWPEISTMAANGIEIGCHTRSHPILSKIPEEELSDQITDTKTALERALEQPVRTFCYPNSAPGDITDRVVEEVVAAGFIGAVFGIDQSAWDPFRIPRIAAGNNPVAFQWKLLGHGLD